jgi:hypothetical protein
MVKIKHPAPITGAGCFVEMRLRFFLSLICLKAHQFSFEGHLFATAVL